MDIDYDAIQPTASIRLSMLLLPRYCRGRCRRWWGVGVWVLRGLTRLLMCKHQDQNVPAIIESAPCDQGTHATLLSKVSCMVRPSCKSCGRESGKHRRRFPHLSACCMRASEKFAALNHSPGTKTTARLFSLRANTRCHVLQMPQTKHIVNEWLCSCNPET